MTNVNKVNVSEEAYKAIYQAIEQVYQATGRKPKYSEVQEIYKTSNSYIKYVLGKWLEEKSEELNEVKEDQTASVIEIPDDDVKQVMSVLVAQAQKAQDRADAKLEDEREAMRRIKAEAEAELEAQYAVADEFFDEVQKLKEEVIKRDNELNTLNNLFSSEKVKNGDLTEKVKHLADDVQRAKKLAADYEAKLSEVTQERNEASALAQTLQMRLDEMTARNDRLTAEFDSYKKDYSKQLDQRDKQLTKLTEQIASLTAESLADKRQIATLEGNNSSLQQSNEDLSEKLVNADKTALSVNQQLLEHQATINQQQDTIKDLTSKIAKPEKANK